MSYLPVGSVVVYTPPGTVIYSPYTGVPRYVVTGDEDEDGYVPLILINGTAEDFGYECSADLTRVYS